ncbi:hypothetical protein ASPSYDRAFT_40318 [Aspergillus sydowii CBS 593.65]|uniref:Zn(2)-C6 fungal-type domain-containing protein n=1 Tax=Aspergillus sydowii CBS 593.65 TaxID=1036612 RepID=A0A1L9TQS6_9EURO|nr:uncharacterized protein ASPSYDRAFT_40318 [Aspergillus sydowii CBS 593.65]OJJ61777.1 hypothetical protein ASPSYDRAFT_40318 [Aspergillus sydowii CBS 593.65]
MDRTAPLDGPQRKKLRRGTRSCWECKRRKMKCVFERPDDAVCVGCHHRWTQCVSQEFPDQVSAPKESTRQLRNRLRRVESRLDQVLNSTSIDQQPHPQSSLPPPGQGLSQTLYNALPSQKDTERIASASSHHSVPFHEILTTPYSILDRDGLRAYGDQLSIPDPNAHPVLIARHMLHLASFLQHLHPDLHDEIRSLSEPAHVLRDRLAETAISLVTTRDQFVGSVEFLECIMIQSLYEANCGYLRRSWMTARRAMAVAQSMGFHQSGARLQYQVLHPDTKAYPHFMWFRLVFYDRQMCLLLGMPEGTLDRSMAFDAMLAQDTDAGRLERQHCVIMSQILERNNASALSDYALTQDLDRQLHRLTRTLPSRWWLTPNLNSEKQKDTLFWDMRRLSAQLCHYNLLNQLHLPYLLRHSKERRYEYSQITCVNASREILTRFIMLRRWNRVAFTCRTIDFTALMAAMTLLLAHLDRYLAPQAEHFLAAQSLGDRAMIEQVQEHMEDLDRLNADPLSAQSARLLRRLLDIEAKAADGDLASAQGVRVQDPENEVELTQSGRDDDKQVYIPYFGVIQAAVSLGSEVLSSDPMQLFEYPGMIPGEDGIFQDLDLGFLDTFMRAEEA